MCSVSFFPFAVCQRRNQFCVLSQSSDLFILLLFSLLYLSSKLEIQVFFVHSPHSNLNQSACESCVQLNLCVQVVPLYVW